MNESVMTADDGAALFDQPARFEHVVDGYAERPGQADMAHAVAEAIDHSSRLVVEAGTGTGKTLAYLLPVLASGRKAIVSTATRYLQGQLADKDIPLAERILGRSVDVSVLKGRSNYLCLHRLDLTEQQAAQQSAGRLRGVRDWAARTRTGDLGELADLGDGDPLWPNITSTADNCLSTECPFFSDCWVVAARREAQAADVVVANHYLFFADLTLRDSGFGEVLPGADAIILDEAHKLPDIAGRFFGQAVSSRQLADLIRDGSTELERLGGDMPAVAERLARLSRAVSGLGARLGAPGQNRSWAALADTEADAARDELAVALQSLFEAARPVAERSEQMRAITRRIGETRDRVNEMAADTAEQVGWLEVRAASWTWHSTPLDVASPFARAVDSLPNAWVLTSATLAVNNDLGYFCSRLGLTDVATRILPSPFDYEHNALLYTPDPMPLPREPNFDDGVIDTAIDLIRAARGGAFVLCTSYRAVARYSQALIDAGIHVLAQGSASRSALLDAFRADDQSVLVATTSFWEGVDVRGRALRLVIIDRLPFASPGDPVLAARFAAMEDAGAKPFMDYQLPQAVIALKQGVGRLIRDATDTGVLAICDPRLTRARYGRIIRDSLPPMPITTDRDRACEFLSELAASS